MSQINEKIELELEQLGNITPFIIALDGDMNVTWASDAVTRRFRNAVGMKISHLVEFAEPHQDCSGDSLSAGLGQWHKLTLLGNNSAAPLAGQWHVSHDRFILLAVPDVKNTEDMDGFGFDDFPANDLSIELLVAREEGAKSMAEAISAAEILKRRNRALDQEIAERTQAEQDLQESRRRYESLFNNTIFGVAVIDKHHKIVRVNPIFAELFKKPLDSFVGKDCFREFEKRDAICPHCPGVRAMVSGRTEEVETEGVRDDGSHFKVHNRAVPFFDSNNEIAGFIEMVEDITTLKQAEEQLIDSAEKYRRLFEGAIDAIFLGDPETGIILDCNQAALKLTGRDRAELVGQHQRILHPPEDFTGKFTKSFEEHRRKTKDIVLEAQIVTKNGDIKDVAIKAGALEIGGKKVLQGIFRDITEKKQREQKLRQIQEEFIEASHHAGMAEVASDVLHNVGNVLNSINVSTTLIHETLLQSEIPNLKKVADMIAEHEDDPAGFLKDDPRGRHIPSYLIKSAELLAHERDNVIDKLDALVNDVNHIKTIIKMQQEYTKASGIEVVTTLEQIIEDAIRINQEGLRRHRIRVVRDDADLGEVIIDKQRVIQILVNLIGNAKYALSGSEITDRTLTIRSSLQDDSRLRIEVADNGVGIPQENLTRIFQHGFTTKNDGHGFGLHSGALAAKEINGSLTVFSEGPGRGATFTLELPFKPAGEIQWTT